jgi:hypothetical protein
VSRRALPRSTSVRLAAGLAVGALGLAACSSAPSSQLGRPSVDSGSVAEPAGEDESAELAEAGLPWGPAERILDSAGEAGGEESFEARTAAEQFVNQRLAPGIVAPGAYGQVAKDWAALPAAGGTWDPVTDVPYDADSELYRDYYSNSSGGAGYVTGRVSAIAASGRYVYAGGA